MDFLNFHTTENRNLLKIFTLTELFSHLALCIVYSCISSVSRCFSVTLDCAMNIVNEYSKSSVELALEDGILEEENPWEPQDFNCQITDGFSFSFPI